MDGGKYGRLSKNSTLKCNLSLCRNSKFCDKAKTSLSTAYGHLLCIPAFKRGPLPIFIYRGPKIQIYISLRRGTDTIAPFKFFTCLRLEQPEQLSWAELSLLCCLHCRARAARCSIFGSRAFLLVLFIEMRTPLLR